MENQGICVLFSISFKGIPGLSQYNHRAHAVETYKQSNDIVIRDGQMRNRRWTTGEIREMARLEAQIKFDKTPNIIMALASSMITARMMLSKVSEEPLHTNV